MHHGRLGLARGVGREPRPRDLLEAPGRSDGAVEEAITLGRKGTKAAAPSGAGLAGAGPGRVHAACPGGASGSLGGSGASRGLATYSKHPGGQTGRWRGRSHSAKTTRRRRPRAVPAWLELGRAVDTRHAPWAPRIRSGWRARAAAPRPTRSTRAVRRGGGGGDHTRPKRHEGGGPERCRPGWSWAGPWTRGMHRGRLGFARGGGREPRPRDLLEAPGRSDGAVEGAITLGQKGTKAAAPSGDGLAGAGPGRGHAACTVGASDSLGAADASRGPATYSKHPGGQTGRWRGRSHSAKKARRRRPRAVTAWLELGRVVDTRHAPWAPRIRSGCRAQAAAPRPTRSTRAVRRGGGGGDHTRPKRREGGG